jgi:hypothetical protein
MLTFLFGVVVGTFIPTPYQTGIRVFVGNVWKRLRGLVI